MRYPGLVVMCQWLSIRLGKDGMGVVGEYKLHTQADICRGALGVSGNRRSYLVYRIFVRRRHTERSLQVIDEQVVSLT